MNQPTATDVAEAMMRCLSRQVSAMNGSDMYRAKPEHEEYVDVDAEIREHLERKP